MSKFEKSGINTRTEKEGSLLLLRDARFQLVDLLTKRRILELIGITGAFGTQTFDLVIHLRLLHRSHSRPSTSTSRR